uniref:DUF3822 family protein n=1 Tax=Parastrongyloides trichosuri TaxID=131310 RepID=A0A0N4ZIL0_PARTI
MELIKEQKGTNNFIYHIPYRKFVQYNAHIDESTCFYDEAYLIYKDIDVYIIFDDEMQDLEDNHAIVILVCALIKAGFKHPLLIKTKPDKFCDRISKPGSRSFEIYLREFSNATVYTNLNKGYNAGLEKIENKPLCAFLPSGDGTVYLSLNIYGKIYRYYSQTVDGEIKMKYGQYITLLNEDGEQDDFLLSSSDSEFSMIRPFIEGNIQHDGGFLFFSKLSIDIYEIIDYLLDSTIIHFTSPPWFVRSRRPYTMLPIHRHTRDDILPDQSDYEEYKSILDEFKYEV